LYHYLSANNNVAVHHPNAHLLKSADIYVYITFVMFHSLGSRCHFYLPCTTSHHPLILPSVCDTSHDTAYDRRRPSPSTSKDPRQQRFLFLNQTQSINPYSSQLHKNGLSRNAGYESIKSNSASLLTPKILHTAQFRRKLRSQEILRLLGPFTSSI
jgi:hypothetical protein